MRTVLAAAALAAAALAGQAHAVNVVKCVTDHNNVDPEYGGRNYVDPEGTLDCLGVG